MSLLEWVKKVVVGEAKGSSSLDPEMEPFAAQIELIDQYFLEAGEEVRRLVRSVIGRYFDYVWCAPVSVSKGKYKPFTLFERSLRKALEALKRGEYQHRVELVFRPNRRYDEYYANRTRTARIYKCFLEGLFHHSGKLARMDAQGTGEGGTEQYNFPLEPFRRFWERHGGAVNVYWEGGMEPTVGVRIFLLGACLEQRDKEVLLTEYFYQLLVGLASTRPDGEERAVGGRRRSSVVGEEEQAVDDHEIMVRVFEEYLREVRYAINVLHPGKTILVGRDFTFVERDLFMEMLRCAEERGHGVGVERLCETGFLYREDGTAPAVLFDLGAEVRRKGVLVRNAPLWRGIEVTPYPLPVRAFGFRWIGDHLERLGEPRQEQVVLRVLGPHWIEDAPAHAVVQEEGDREGGKVTADDGARDTLLPVGGDTAKEWPAAPRKKAGKTRRKKEQSETGAVPAAEADDASGSAKIPEPEGLPEKAVSGAGETTSHGEEPAGASGTDFSGEFVGMLERAIEDGDLVLGENYTDQVEGDYEFVERTALRRVVEKNGYRWREWLRRAEVELKGLCRAGEQGGLVVTIPVGEEEKRGILVRRSADQASSSGG